MSNDSMVRAAVCGEIQARPLSALNHRFGSSHQCTSISGMRYWFQRRADGLLDALIAVIDRPSNTTGGEGGKGRTGVEGELKLKLMPTWLFL